MASYPDPLSHDWDDHVLAREAEIQERDLCPKCGGPWQEPAGVSLDYNADRAAYVGAIVSREGYLRDRLSDDSLPPWEEWVIDEVGDPRAYLICASCVAREGGLPAHRVVWFWDAAQ